MTKTQVEVITSVQRRRRWLRSEKERIVAAALEPGAIASEVARAEGIHPAQLFRWRQELCAEKGGAPGFAAVAVIDRGEAVPSPAAPGSIEIEFASGTRIRLSGTADATIAGTIVSLLVKAERRR